MGRIGLSDEKSEAEGAPPQGEVPEVKDSGKPKPKKKTPQETEGRRLQRGEAQGR